MLTPVSVRAGDEKVTVYLFWSSTCPHCRDEKDFLAKLVEKYPQVQVKDFEVSGNADNSRLFKKVAQEFGNERGLVPFTVIGDQHVLGFYNEQTTGEVIETLVKNSLETPCPDVVASIISPEPTISLMPTPAACANDCGCGEVDQDLGRVDKLTIPLLGEINIKGLSLPVLSVILGLIDGFNPCAMWALVFLISLLLGMEDGYRRWLLGAAFIVTSAFVYFLFMSAWLNLFLFLGYISWIRVIVGLAAFIIAGYCLNDFWKNRGGVCKVTGGERKTRITDLLREVIEGRNLGGALVGIVLLAFVVNLIELICSAGFPAVFTHILSLSNLNTWQYYSYLLAYVFFFMLDDLLIFFIAMTTLKAVGLDGKYARYSRLIGGILILIIGLLLLFKPEWLMFG